MRFSFLVLAILLTQLPRNTRVGDVAVGVVIFENEQELEMDAKPCEGKEEKIIFHFKQPYKKTTLGTLECPDGKKYSKVQVIQQ